MVDIKTLLPDLRKLVKDLTDDLLQHGSKASETAARLQDEYQQFRGSGRISQSFEEWREDYLEQVAVAWVIACIFVRFIEDNELINEGYIAGEGDRGKLAEGEYTIYFRHRPHDSDREYLKHVFEEIGKLPAAAEIFAKDKNPLWAIDPSGDSARNLIKFFQETNAELGGLKRSFRTVRVTVSPIVEVYQGLAPQARFLGDLYQDLSEHAQKKYALKQTPEFIQLFILDRTLNRAVDEFGLKNLRLIDPACGSGHFLLGAFDRLLEEWMKPHNFAQCNHNLIVAAQNAFDSIHGVDINPFAIAITRFRLFVAAVQACDINRLNQQTQAWKFNVAVGDSLLRGSRPDSFGKERVRIQERQLTFDFDERPQFAFEEARAANEILDKSYHVVVGNPPYITIKDKAQNEAYRQHFRHVCYRQYSLGVPFTQRFWELAIREGEQISPGRDQTSPAAGYVGMITANSFMKREFGKKLIEDFFPKTDLTHVLDTSGAYIPGHGTPTVILLGRGRRPVGETVRAVLGIKGEPSTPADPSLGRVWQSIVRQIDQSDVQDEFTSTADVPRSTLASHPWSIGGGGAAELKDLIESGSGPLADVVELPIGRAVRIAEEDVFMFDAVRMRHSRASSDEFRHFLLGEAVRDYSANCHWSVWYPYSGDCSTSRMLSEIWPWKTVLANRSTFQGVMSDAGLEWFEYMQHTASAYRTPLSIAFAFVASHNHFVLDRGGKVFKQSAPIIKLLPEATEDDHLALLGLLNSSTACFWMKQTFHNKGNEGYQSGIKSEHWEKFYEFTGTGLQQYPITERRPILLARMLDELGREYSANLPDVVVAIGTPSLSTISEAKLQSTAARGRMIALQEELDWQCYRLYGLLGEDLNYGGQDLPEIELGQRAFEIFMARQITNCELETTWFERHCSRPITEIPRHWPAAYRDVVARRIEVIGTNKEIGLIERPEYKRRWNTEPWKQQEQRALRSWLLDRLESRRYWPDLNVSEPTLQTTAQLADKASSAPEFMEVAALYKGREDFDVGALVAELVTSESVPFLPLLRYKASGRRKREVWERTWEHQRKEDASEPTEPIPIPPKYAAADFQKTDYWRLRGKLDVPKERWISYPHCSTESDPTLLVGWAGWNHLQQATALVGYYDARKREGWDARRLMPLLAGLDQLLPWIRQWHSEIDPEFGETAGSSFQTMLAQDSHELGLTLEEIRSWEPPATTRRRRTRTN